MLTVPTFQSCMHVFISYMQHCISFLALDVVIGFVKFMLLPLSLVRIILFIFEY
jgi:hypothetical protein